MRNGPQRLTSGSTGGTAAPASDPSGRLIARPCVPLDVHKHWGVVLSQAVLGHTRTGNVQWQIKVGQRNAAPLDINLLQKTHHYMAVNYANHTTARDSLPLVVHNPSIPITVQPFAG
jgi:hypothetical protein